MSKTIIDLIEDGWINSLTPSLKYSIWSLVQRGKSRQHMRMMIQSKTARNLDLRDACYVYIDRCIAALAAGTGYPV